jgi:hypothetical protein
MKSKKYPTVMIRTVSKSNRKIIVRGKFDTLTHKYMTIHFPGWTQAL